MSSTSTKTKGKPSNVQEPPSIYSLPSNLLPLKEFYDAVNNVPILPVVNTISPRTRRKISQIPKVGITKKI